MSMRPASRANLNSALSADLGPKTPINFKDEFVHSTAALAASHDETVSHILSRLDQLQAKIQTQPESGGATAAPLSAATPSSSGGGYPSSNQLRAPGSAPRAAGSVPPSDQSVHARLSSLESIHEDALHRLHSKLDLVEERLASNRETEGLMTQLASRLQQVEPRLQSHAALSDRIATLESRARLHSELHDRVKSLEAAVRPDPEQERILARINAKLDILEEQQHHHRNAVGARSGGGGGNRQSSSSTFVGADAHDNHRLDPGAARHSFDASSLSSRHLDADMDRQDRVQYLQKRIEKLKELRSRYEAADEH